MQYPYIPAHVTKPKEHKRLYLVQLPEKGLLLHSVWRVAVLVFCLYLLVLALDWVIYGFFNFSAQVIE